MRAQKTFVTLVAVLIVAAFLGIYGHAALDDHGAAEGCSICAFLQDGRAHIVVVFSLSLILASQVFHVFVCPLFKAPLPIATPGRSPPIS